MAWLAGWTYRKSITLSRASGAVTNYQMKLLVGESSGASGEDVDCAAHCKTDFSDLRFTTSDGTTLLDYWIETTSGTTPNQLATVWIEFDSIGTGATTFYMYYGKADASAVSNGTNTFIQFDNFERGSNGDTIGGSWTEATAHIHISTEQTYTGTRSAKLVGGTTPAATIPLTAGSGYAIRLCYYKEDDADVVLFLHGNGSKVIEVLVTIAEDIQTYDGSFRNIGVSAAGMWRLIEVANINFSAGTFDVYYNGSLIKSGAAMATENWVTNLFAFQGSGTADRDTWIDNYIVRNWLATEPAWGSWGAEETTGTTTITVSDSTSASSYEAMNLVQHHQLTLADSTSGSSCESLELSYAAFVALTATDAASSASTETPILLQWHIIALSDMRSPPTMEAVVLSQRHTLAVSDSTSPSSSESVELFGEANLRLANATSSCNIEGTSLRQAHTLAVADMASAAAAEAFTDRFEYYNLGVSDATSEVSIEQPLPLQAHTLALADLTSNTLVEGALEFLQAGTVTIRDSRSTTSTEPVTLHQHHCLSVDDSTSTSTSEEISTIIRVVAADDGLSASSSEPLALTGHHHLVVQDSLSLSCLESPGGIAGLTYAEITNVVSIFSGRKPAVEFEPLKPVVDFEQKIPQIALDIQKPILSFEARTPRLQMRGKTGRI